MQALQFARNEAGVGHSPLRSVDFFTCFPADRGSSLFAFSAALLPGLGGDHRLPALGCCVSAGICSLSPVSTPGHRKCAAASALWFHTVLHTSNPEFMEPQKPKARRTLWRHLLSVRVASDLWFVQDVTVARADVFRDAILELFDQAGLRVW